MSTINPNQPFAYGFVKSVLSGDCLVLLGGAVQGQKPQEKVVVLSGIAAPRFARSKSSKDEPYAWESRDFLRKKVIGKQVAFHTIASSGTGREYANVYLEQQNLAHMVVKAGLATVKLPPKGGRLSTEKEAMVAMQEEATMAGAGMHNKKDAPEDHVRKIDWAPDAEKLFNKFKGVPVDAVIHQIRDGSIFRCEVMGSVKAPSKQGRDSMMVTLYLAGAQSPRMPISHDYRMAQHAQKKAADANYDEPEPEVEQAPEYAAEAVSFVETRLLNREVKILILGLDMSNNVYGSILYSRGNITSKLLETGFAKYVPWTAIMTSNAAELKAAADKAKAQKLRLGASAADDKLLPEFSGKVVFIQSGDTVSVKNEAGKEVRVSLASIRAPRIGNARRGEKSQLCAMEAREYLRKRLIGKKVRVQPEYTRGTDERVYGTVFHNDINVGLALVGAGLAECIPHRQEEPRSLHYAKLMEANVNAKKTNQGKYAMKPTSQQIVDLTDRPPRGKKGSDDAQSDAARGAMSAKARSYLPFLQREKSVQGVVEYCFSASRVKVLVPKENCMISLALAGIKCPRAGPGGDPLGDEGLALLKSKALQQNVRLEVETIDRGDNFIGSLFVGGSNMSVALLDAGLAELNGFSAERSPYYADLLKAETAAKEKKLKIWENYVEKVIVNDGDEESATKGLKDSMDVKVTEINDATSFYFQVADDKNVAAVTEQMEAFNNSVPEALEGAPAKGMLMAGLYTDGQWYRVKTEGLTASGTMRVCFVDFGNHDILEVANLRALPADLTTIPPLARAAVLAGLKAPTKVSEHFEGAAITFNDMAYDRVLSAKVECVGKDGKVHLTLTDSEEPDLSLNQVLLRDGWCRVMERPEYKIKALCNKLKADEEVAKNARINIWEYGDVSDEEEDEAPKPGRFDGRTGKPIQRS